MSKKIVTITGGNGFIGLILQSGLRNLGYQVVVFDRMNSFLVGLLRKRYLGTSTKRIPCALASTLRRVMRLKEGIFIKAGIIVPSGDDILDIRSRLVDRFRGSYAVIHSPPFHIPMFRVRPILTSAGLIMRDLLTCLRQRRKPEYPSSSLLHPARYMELTSRCGLISFPSWKLTIARRWPKARVCMVY